MRIAAIQMISSPRLEDNLTSAAELLRGAAEAGAELALLPEYFCIMGLRDRDKLALQERDGDPDAPLQAFLASQARTLGLYLVGGTIPLSSGIPDKAYNSTLVYDPQGQRLARYDKIHLFAFQQGREAYNEGNTLLAGKEPVAFTLTDKAGQDWRVGLSVCYDLRFAELYQRLAADLLLLPAAFTHTTGQAHWEILLRARAIENQAFVLAAAQGGQHENGRATWGQSMVVDPWGQILAQQKEGEGVILADIDFATLVHTRTKLPALRHRVLV